MIVLALTTVTPEGYISHGVRGENRMNYKKIICAICLMAGFGASATRAQDFVTFTVTWNPVSDPGVSEILVYRSITDQIGDFAIVGSANPSDGEFVDDSALEKGVKYYYRLRSRNTYGQISGFSNLVSAMILDTDSSEELKSECRINSVTGSDESSWEVDWSTVIPTTGVLEYWIMDSSEVQSIECGDVADTGHLITLTGLDEDRIYFIHAVAHCEAGENMIISADFSFATSSSPQELDFVFDPASVTVPEGAAGQFGIRLSGIPDDDVTVSVIWAGGDGDITVESGASLIFSPDDWYIPQTVTLQAAEDVDEADGQAVLTASSISGPSVNTGNITATENDNDTGEDPHEDTAAAVIAIYPMPYQPSSGSMTIDNLPSSGRIGIYDLRGQKVWDESWDGSNSLAWDGTSNSGASVASGRYFVVINDSDGQVTGKRVILVVN